MFILKNMFTLVRRFCHLSRVFSNFSKRKTFFCSTASLLSLAQSTKLFVSKLYSVLHCTAPLWLPLALERRAEASAVWRKGNCLKAKPVGRIGCQRSGSGWLGAGWGLAGGATSAAVCELDPAFCRLGLLQTSLGWLY